MKPLRLLLGLIILLSLSACALTSPTPSVGAIQTAIAETAAVQPPDNPIQPTPSPSASASASAIPGSPATSTPDPTITPTPSGPIPGTVNVQFLNMRKGPSTMFEVVNTYLEGTEITARVRVAENDWVQVEVEDENGEIEIGWMAAPFIELEKSLTTLGIANIPESLKVRGRVEGTNGFPLPEITIAVIYGAPTGDLRSDVTTNPQGEFIAYLPQDLLGTLDIQVFEHSCKSPVMDNDCNFANYIQLEGRVFITIPQQTDIVFKYQPATLILTGVVQTKSGTPVQGISIIAERNDGARSYTTSKEEGAFSMPVAEGIWKIYTRDAESGVDGPAVIITVTTELPDPVELVTS